MITPAGHCGITTGGERGKAYPQAQLVRKHREGVHFEHWADKLMDKAELLRGAHVDQIGEDPDTQRARAALEATANLGGHMVLVVVVRDFSPLRHRT